MSALRKVACVEIGGIPIALSTSDDAFLDLLNQRYTGFLSSSPPEFELEFDLTSSGPISDDDVRVRLNDNANREWILERGDFRANWNSRTGRGTVRQNSNPYSLDSVLRILHSLILAERGGFLLHAASAICDGHAFLFSGVSGAGKTTMTKLAPSDTTLLTDEISYLRPNAGGYSAFGTPFAGELARSGENCAAPVSALFFLEQGPENRIQELSSAEAVRRLMRNILFFAEDRGLVEKLFATACDFADRVPIRRLTFYPDASVWDLIRNFEGNFGAKFEKSPAAISATASRSRPSMPDNCTYTYIARSSAIAARALAGEMMVMNSADSTFFTLNEVATAIFQAADGRTPLHEIVRDRVCDQFDVDSEQAQSDAEQFVAELSGHGILMVSNQPLSSDAAPETRR